MNSSLKKALDSIGIYHPLQSTYRGIIEKARAARFRMEFAKFKGKGFVCNFCLAQYEKFVPELPAENISQAIANNAVIAGYGENVFCPNCMSKNRERLILALLQHILPIENKTVLHFSPEKNLYDYIRQRARVTTADIMPGFYRQIDPTIVYSDATKLEFADSSYEIIIANHILEHIPEDRKAMKELHRVLKPGGVAILQVPYSEKLETTIEEPFINDPKRQELLFGQKDHVRIYALNDYVDRLQHAGFRVKILGKDNLKAFRIHAIQENEKLVLGYKE